MCFSPIQRKRKSFAQSKIKKAFLLIKDEEKIVIYEYFNHGKNYKHYDCYHKETPYILTNGKVTRI